MLIVPDIATGEKWGLCRLTDDIAIHANSNSELEAGFVYLAEPVKAVKSQFLLQIILNKLRQMNQLIINQDLLWQPSK